MSVHLTSSLQKSLPALSLQTTNEDWAKVSTAFIDQSIETLQKQINVFTQNIDILEHQKGRCAELIAYLEEAGGLTVRARNLISYSGTTDENKKQLDEWQDWFGRAVAKLDLAVQQSSYQNINLLKGDSLVTPMDLAGHNKLETTGHNLTSESLGIRPADFSTLFSVQNARIDIMNAIDMVVTVRNIIAGHISSLTISLDFAQQSVHMAETAHRQIKSIDLAGEMSSLIQLTQDKSKAFPIEGETLADPAQQEILNNFASSAIIPDET